MAEILIELENVSKTYGGKELIKDVNLSIQKGQSISFIGHNGVGKSTLLKMIARLVNATSGKIIYLSDISLSYIPEHFPKMNLTARQYIFHMGKIDGLDKDFLNQRSRQLFETFYMQSMMDIPMKHLSKGSLQKVGVIQALLKSPDVLLLDEPLSGQDMESKKAFISTMDQLRNQGVTLIMSCHEKYLINRISDTVFEIKNKLLLPVSLSDDIFKEQDILIFENKGSAIIPALDYPVENTGNQIKITVPTDQSNEVLLLLLQNKWRLKGMYHENSH